MSEETNDSNEIVSSAPDEETNGETNEKENSEESEKKREEINHKNLKHEEERKKDQDCEILDTIALCEILEPIKDPSLLTKIPIR